MAITLTVNNIPFDYPEQGEQQPWGEAATGWAVEVTNTLASLKGPSDILETFFTLSNNQSTFANINNFSFDSITVRSFVATGNIYRVYNSGTELVEEFTLTGLNTNSDWLLQQEGFGDCGVTFNITPQGQIQYKSSNLNSTTQFKIKFKATAILK